MSNVLVDRVQARLEALEINPFEAARRGGLERSFVNDLLIGKKTTVRHDKLPALAKGLDCDVEYLEGLQASPKAGEWEGEMRLVGIVEADTWRPAPGEKFAERLLPLGPDPRYPAIEQVAFLVRGDHAEGLHIYDGSIVTVLRGAKHVRTGDIVVVKRTRPKEVEYSIREVMAGAYRARPAPSAKVGIAPIPTSDGKVYGLVLSAHRVFGTQT